jgi:hypothetical protein
VSVFGSGGK